MRQEFRPLWSEKNLERVETIEEYEDMIYNARKSPFIIVKESEYAVKDFEPILQSSVQVPKQLLIRKAARISYHPNGFVDVYENYTDECKTYFIESLITFDKLQPASPADASGIDIEKLTDVKKLLRYLSPKGKCFFESFFDKGMVKPKKVPKDYISDKLVVQKAPRVTKSKEKVLEKR